MAGGGARRLAGGAGGRAGVRVAGSSATGFYLAQTRHDPWRGTAAPRWVARRTLTRQRSSLLVAATSALCRARAIGAAKSVSLKKIGRVRFKISLEKRLKLKKKVSYSRTAGNVTATS